MFRAQLQGEGRRVEGKEAGDPSGETPITQELGTFWVLVCVVLTQDTHM